MNVTDQFLATDTVRTGIELGIALTLVVLLVRYEYLRRVTGKQVVVTGLLAAVTTILFIGLVVRKILSFLAF